MANESMTPDWSKHGAKWTEQDAVFDRAFAPATEALIEAADLRGQVLDVGCGSGTLLEAVVAAGATAVGVDISPAMVAAAAARVPQARSQVADAQTADLAAFADGPGFDRLISRFGVMFFDDPDAAFANLRRALNPDGEMAFLCWRKGPANPMFTLGTQTLLHALPTPPAKPAPGAPGPLAFADPDRVTAILSGSGWRDIAVTPLDFVSEYAATLPDGTRTDGVEERLAVVLATSTGQLAEEALRPALGDDGWAGLLEKVRADLREQFVDGRVAHPSYCWLVTARP